MSTERIARAANDLVVAAIDAEATIAVAESLTGGLVASSLVAVPGTSAVFRGGIVSYQTPVKHTVLDVDAELLAAVGPVDPQVAQAMAERVRALFVVDGVAAAIGLATTGVAGPTDQDGHPVGDVFVAVATAETTRVEHLMLTGSRDEIRTQAVAAVLELGREVVTEM